MKNFTIMMYKNNNLSAFISRYNKLVSIYAKHKILTGHHTDSVLQTHTTCQILRSQ